MRMLPREACSTAAVCCEFARYPFDFELYHVFEDVMQLALVVCVSSAHTGGAYLQGARRRSTECRCGPSEGDCILEAAGRYRRQDQSQRTTRNIVENVA
jgi:hypothetical protein